MEEALVEGGIAVALCGVIAWMFRRFVPDLLDRAERAAVDARAAFREELADTRDAFREELAEQREVQQGCPWRDPEAVQAMIEAAARKQGDRNGTYQ